MDENSNLSFIRIQKRFYFVCESDAKVGGRAVIVLMGGDYFSFDGRTREIDFDSFRYIFSDLII